MIKFLPILTTVITEQKRFKFDPITYTKLIELTDKLWSMRNKKFDKKTMVDQFNFKTSDGADGLVKLYVNPRFPHFGQLDTRPKKSTNPMDLVIQLNPKKYSSRKNLFLTIYHEMLHATDPKFTSKYSEEYWSDYDPKVNEKYWGHPVEFRSVTNEFLEALVNEFKRRAGRLGLDGKKHLLMSLGNIVNYFAKNESLSKLSLNILERLNDEKLNDNRISSLLADITTDYPKTADLFNNEEKPYYLTYIELIKTYNPKMWSRFLSMLYSTKEEILEFLEKTDI